MYSSGQGSCHHGSALGRECEGMQKWISNFEHRELRTVQHDHEKKIQQHYVATAIWYEGALSEGHPASQENSWFNMIQLIQLDRPIWLLSVGLGLKSLIARHWPVKEMHCKFLQKADAFQHTRMHAHRKNTQKGHHVKAQAQARMSHVPLICWCAPHIVTQTHICPIDGLLFSMYKTHENTRLVRGYTRLNSQNQDLHL